MKIVWLVAARNQLELILEYISLDSPKAAEKYTSALFSKTNDLLRHPDIGMVYTTKGSKVIRRLIIDKTKFILYRVDHKCITVLVLVDARTNWKK
jgi:plasmid stabilization system protein ParE